ARLRLAGLAELSGRGACWQAAWRTFVAHPVCGSGLDTFGLAFPAYRTEPFRGPEWAMLASRAHNDFLEALATRGALGGLAYLLFPAALAHAGLRAWRKRPSDRVLLLAGLASALAFYVAHLFGFAVAACSTLLMAVAGVLSRLGEDEE